MSVHPMFADPELIQEFLTETQELLENLDNDLVNLETDPQNKALLDRIFRAIHTIKGTSGFLGFEQLVELTHAAEDLLHLYRNGERTVTSNAMDVVLETTSTVKELVAQVRNQDIHPIDIAVLLQKLGEIKSGKTETAGTASPSAVPPAAGAEAKKEVLQDVDSSTIRVDVKRLDDMMNLVGELVFERNRLLQINREHREQETNDHFAEKIAETTEKIHFITTELQLSVLKTRMIPIDRLFRKFHRMVRDLARDMSKEVELILSGGDTELDKTVIDQLSDPLVHLLRNSIDHGLEQTDVRVRAGKSRMGKVMLSATQEGNHIILSVKDDGKGLDIEKIKQKALDRGLVTSEQSSTISKQEIMQLIFLPGFSTADQVSNISGRGVGMDVVRTNIKNLSGMIDVFSEPGIGTEVVLKLPLTLAIMQALMVRVEDEIYAIPLASVIETIRIQESDIKTVHQREVVTHRESVIPILRLSTLFEVKFRSARADEAEDTESQFEYVVLVGSGEKRFGLVVNRLIGQEEVVIKSLGDYLGGVPGVAGGTITGDGRVRLIVDCANIDQLI